MPIYQNVLTIKEAIGELKHLLTKRKCELEGLKLVRKEISESELRDTIKKLEEECEHFRTLSVKLMRKYSGEREMEGMEDEDHHNYRYSNLVLQEYDDLLNELSSTLKKVQSHKLKKEVGDSDDRNRSRRSERDSTRSRS